MRQVMKWLIAPAVVLSAACGGKNEQANMDDALRSDLALAASVQPYQQQQYVSPMEQGYAMPVQRVPANGGYYGQGVYQPQPVAQRAPAPVRRTSTTARSTGTVRREPVRHTKRDAMIGATAGAVIGATSSRDKLKGAVIGAAAGGLLGAVVGHTVDVDP